MSPDVAIVGGGVIGSVVAYHLAKEGLKVLVLDAGDPGAEASSAAAGMLAAQAEAHVDGPLLDLCLASRELFPRLCDGLREEAEIDVELRRCGVLRIAFDKAQMTRLESELAFQQDRGLSGTKLDSAALAKREPALSSTAIGGVLFEADGRVDPPLFTRALRLASEKMGVVFRAGARVTKVVVEAGNARGVALETGEVLASGSVVVAAGSWSSLVSGTGLTDRVKPARGQMVELRCARASDGGAQLLQGVVMGPNAYLSPRDDGRVLVGSTMEWVGFEKRVTAGAVAKLLAAALEMAPRLEQAELSRTWSSFRPYTEDQLPLLGKTETPGLLVATGHHRNGILLTPITGQIIASAILGRPPPLELTAFSPSRRRSTA